MPTFREFYGLGPKIPKKLFTSEEAMRALKTEVGRYRSASEFARAVKVSKAHLSRVLDGQRMIDGRLAARIGMKRIDAYVRSR